MGIWYTTREDVILALNSTDNSINARKIDSAIESASRSVDKLTKRRFYPETKTKTFDYPQNSLSYRLWFDSPEELIEATSVTSGGSTITSQEYFLEPVNYGPPFNRLELNLGTSASFDTDETTQHQIQIAGVWGYQFETTAVTTLSGSINASQTTAVVADVSDIGVGSLVQIGTELVQVTDKAWTDSSQNASALTASANSVSITGVTGINQFETILIDSERMLVTDVAGTTITVKRAVDGSTLAAHSLNADIYVQRSLTIKRGVGGTTAASHTSGDAVNLFVFPAPIVELTLAEAINTFKQRGDAYSRTVGSGENQREATGRALAELRKAVKRDFGRVRIA